MGVTRVGPRVQLAGIWQRGGFEPLPRHKELPTPGGFLPKEKTMLELFPGLVDVLIVAGMCGTAVLLYAAAVLVRSLR